VRIVPVQEHGLLDDLAAKAAHCHGTLCETKFWESTLSRLNLLAAVVLSGFSSSVRCGRQRFLHHISL
jgi:hypothetical protein